MSFIKRFKTFLLAAVLSIAVLGFSPKVSAQNTEVQSASSAYESASSSVTAQFYYNIENTISGDLLQAVVVASAHTNNSATTPPIISTPVTTDGSTWVLVNSVSSPVLTEAGPTYLVYTISIFDIINAPSKLEYPYTDSVLVTDASVSPCGGSCYVAANIYTYEFSPGSSGSLASVVTSAISSGTSGVPTTTNLVVPSTSLIYTISAYHTPDAESIKTSSGYTQGRATFGSYSSSTDQYALNAVAGSNPTAFTLRNSQTTDMWADIAVAYGPAAPIVPPPPITYQYGIQPWETTEGEVSLDTLNVNVNIPVVDKDGVGLPFVFALNFNNNFWFLGNCDNSSVDPGVTCWQPNSNNFGWMPDASQMYGAYVAIPTICPDSVGNGGSAALDFVAYQDPQGNMHPIDPNTVISFSGNACNYPGTKAVVSTDGSGYTYNLAFPTDGQTFSNVDQAIPIVGTGTPQVVASNGTVMTPGIIYYNNPGALGNSAVPWGMPNYITGISSEDTNSNTISTPAQSSWPVHHIAPAGPWTFTDTVGVGEVAVAPETFVGPPNSQLLGPSGPGGPCAAGGTQTYTYPTSTGTASATVGCQQYTIATNFQCPVFDTATQAYVSAYEWPFIDHVSSFQAYFPSSVTLADGSQYQFTYESQLPGTTSGRLANITYPDGSVISYAYPGANNGTNCYDGSLIGLTRTSPDGVTNYSRTQTGVAVGSHLYNTTTVVGPASAYNTSVYTFNQQPAGYHQSEFMVQEQDYQGPLVSNHLLKSVTYCYNGNQSSCVTANSPTYPITQKDIYTTLAGVGTPNRVSKTYDSYGNITSIAIYDFGASTPTQKLSLTNFGQSWNGSTSSPACASIGNGVNNAPCQSELFNSAGTPIGNTFYSYSSSGQLLSNSSWVSGSITSGVYLTTSATYNSNGTIATTTDAAGNISNYVYSSIVCNGGKPTSITVPGTISLTSSITWDSGCNGSVPNTITDPNGRTATVLYNDPFWRITKVTDQEGNSTSTSYTPTTVESVLPVQSSVLDVYHQVNSSSLTTYDQQLEGPESASWDSIISGWNWNSSGIQNYEYVPCAGAKATNCATAGITTNTHDALNRSLIITDGGGGTITRTYIGQDVLTVLGPAPVGEVVKQVQNEYNGLGQLVSTCEISNASQPLPNVISCGQVNGGYLGYLTSYTYNPSGTIASVSKASSVATQTHSFTYDLIGRMLTSNYPESGTTTYTYDSSTGTCAVSFPGQLVRVNDANGNQSCYTYDGLNRNTSITYTGTNFDGYNQYFVYDKAVVDGIAMPNAKGHIAESYTAATIHGTKYIDEGFGYTVRGEMSDVYEFTPNSGGYHHVAATYYANGALNSISGIAGGPWTYSIDGKGRSNGVTNGLSVDIVKNVTYNSADQPIVITYGSGDTDTYSYDINTDRIVGYAFSIGGLTDSSTLVWNANGTLNSLNVNDFNAAGTQTCNYGSSKTPGYDVLGRLLSVSCLNSTGKTVLWGQNFNYDAFDNLSKIATVGTTWNPGYSAVNNQPLGTTADSNGNLLTDTFHTYTWNQNNKVKSVTDAGITAIYDAMSNIVERYNGSTYTQPILSPIGNLGLWNGKSVSQFRIPLPGGSTVVSGNNLWHKDWLGSTRLISNLLLGTSTEDMAFAPYGEVYDIVQGPTDVSFTGDSQDLVVGTYDTPSRELNPNQGRWLSPDPLHSGWNAYAYSTDPLGTTDTSGNQDDAIDSGNTATLSTCGGGACDDVWDWSSAQTDYSTFMPLPTPDFPVPSWYSSFLPSSDTNLGIPEQFIGLAGAVVGAVGTGYNNFTGRDLPPGSIVLQMASPEGLGKPWAPGGTGSLGPGGVALPGEPPIGYEGQGQYGNDIGKHIRSRIGNVTGTHLITELGRLADSDVNPLTWNAVDTLNRIKYKGNSAQYEIVRDNKLLNHFNNIEWSGPRSDKFVLPPNGISEKDLIFLNKAQSKSLWFWKSWDDYHIPGTRF